MFSLDGSDGKYFMKIIKNYLENFVFFHIIHKIVFLRIIQVW